MKNAIVPISLVNVAPFARMDAGYWVRVAERSRWLGVSLTDTAAMREIQLTYAALYPQRMNRNQPRGLGELVEAAEQFNLGE